jgi:hypothetical protein
VFEPPLPLLPSWQASYRTTIYVANATLDNPKIATLAANLTIAGQVRALWGLQLYMR